MHYLKNTHNHKLKNLPQKTTTTRKNPPQQKNLVEVCKKNSKKKFPQKNFKKKIEERLPRFSRSQIGGGGGYGLYKCVMVVTHLYTYTGKEIGTEIGTKIGRYGEWR